jgi:signal transduction histidine kinase
LRIWDIYLPDVTGMTISHDEKRDMNLNSSLMVLTQFVTIFFTALYMAQDKPLSIAINVVCFFALMFNGIYFKKTANFKNSFTIYSIIVLLIISFDHAMEPDYNNSNLYWLPPCLFSAYYLLDKFRRNLVTAIGIIFFTLAYLFKYFYKISPTVNITTELDALIINISTMLLSTVVIYFVSRFFYREETMVKNQLEELSSSNANLLSVISHDLGSSIAVVKNSLATLHHSQRSYDRIVDTVNIMEGIISDTRKLNAIGQGKQVLEVCEVFPAVLISNVFTDLEEMASAKKIKLKYESDFEEDFSILCDEKSLRSSVLANLLTNAIKFSHPNKTVTVKTWCSDNNQLVITVSDSGIGIPQQMIDDLFDFSRPTTRNGTDGEQGTGFGLPIANMYIELYGAELNVESRPIEEFPNDHGTDFHIIFDISCPES